MYVCVCIYIYSCLYMFVCVCVYRCVCIVWFYGINHCRLFKANPVYSYILDMYDL